MKVEDREWREFFIKNIFITENKKKIQVPTGAYIKKNDLFNGRIPRITVTSENNGIDSFCQSKHNNFRKYKNFISVSFLGTVFYHQYEASIEMKVHILQLKNRTLNLYLGLFLNTATKKNIEDVSYANQISSTDLPHKKILLPINKNNQPDYKFMEDYTKSIIKQKREKYINYIKEKLKSIEYKPIEDLKDKEWREFFLTDIFDIIQRGKRLTKAKQKKGFIPYVSSKALNNGIDNFILNKENVRIFDNCLTIANSGSVGASFFHPYKFVASDHVTNLKNNNFNEYIYLFIVTITNRLSKKYNFNREINDKRISREKILLPVDKNNQPDYKYMEQYIKNMEYKKINRYLEFKTL